MHCHDTCSTSLCGQRHNHPSGKPSWSCERRVQHLQSHFSLVSVNDSPFFDIWDLDRSLTSRLCHQSTWQVYSLFIWPCDSTSDLQKPMLRWNSEPSRLKWRLESWNDISSLKHSVFSAEAPRCRSVDQSRPLFKTVLTAWLTWARWKHMVAGDKREIWRFLPLAC